MAGNQPTDMTFEGLPEVVHQEIVSHMGPSDRFSIGGVSDYWRNIAKRASNYSKIAILPNTPYTGHSQLGLKFLFRDHAVFLLESWTKSVECIQFCGEKAQITSLMMFGCQFDDNADWTNIGELLKNLDSLTIVECRLYAPDISEILGRTTSLIDLTIVAMNTRIEGLPNVFRLALQNNRSLKHLTIRDPESLYENISVRSNLISLHVSVTKGFDDYFWYSVKARCRQSLRKLCIEYFKERQHRVFTFEHLTDLRLANARIHLMPHIFSNPQSFPVLEAFTFHHRSLPPGYVMMADNCQYIISQSPLLRVHNTANFFRDGFWLQNVAMAYPQLQFMVLNIMANPVDEMIMAVQAMTQLRFLVFQDTANARIDDQIMNVMIQGLIHLRVIIYRTRHVYDYPFEATFNTITNLAIDNPNTVYFVSLPGIVVFQHENVRNALDERYNDIFLFWDDPFASLYSYNTWEQISLATLEEFQ